MDVVPQVGLLDELVARRLVPLGDLNQPPPPAFDILPGPSTTTTTLALGPIHQGIVHLAVEVAPTVLAFDDDGVGAPALRARRGHRSAPIVVMDISEQASMPSINPGTKASVARGSGWTHVRPMRTLTAHDR